MRRARSYRRSSVQVVFDAMNTRFDGLQRIMVQFAGAMIVAFVAGFLGLIATQL
jgi:hypothetical protein